MKPGLNTKEEQVLQALHLPVDLIAAMMTNTLDYRLDRAYRQIEELKYLLDQWEAANPAAAAVAPWRKTRDEWIAAGRPAANWWEVLPHTFESPITVKDIVRDLLQMPFGPRVNPTEKSRAARRKRQNALNARKRGQT